MWHIGPINRTPGALAHQELNSCRPGAFLLVRPQQEEATNQAGR